MCAFTGKLSFANRFLPLLATSLILGGSEVRLMAAEGASQNYPQEFQQLIAKAVRDFTARDFASVLATLDKADKIVPDSPVSLNSRGAIAIEQHRFEEGKRLCDKALEKDPTFFPARFNLGEVLFMQKDYAAARAIFSALLDETPRNELLQYRVFVTWLLEGNDEAARDALDKIKFPSNTGGYYYAHAAWDFVHGDREKAIGWVRSGDWVFSPASNVPFADVCYDLGWMPRPKGAPSAVHNAPPGGVNLSSNLSLGGN